MTGYILGNLRTGRRILDLNVLSGAWDDRLDTAETITCTLDMNDPDVWSLDLRNTARPAQAFLAAVEGDRFLGAGPIWTRTYNRDAGTVELGAKGLASIFDHRMILPLLAKTIGVDQWTVPDPTDATKTIPNPLLSTTINGVSLGTIAKRLVEQARMWTGGDLPIVFQDDEADDRTKTYLGVDFKPIMEALNDLTNLVGGPEVNFQARWTEDRLGVEWVMQTGTVAQPLITSPSIILWDVTVPESPVSKLKIVEDATGMASLAWQVGGRQEDEVLIARAEDDMLVDTGFPLLETVDTSHTSVSDQATLDAYAATDVMNGRTPTETWSFTVKANPVDRDGNPSGPQLGSYSVGDFVDLNFAPFNKDTGVGDPYLQEGGVYPNRIIGLSGSTDSEDVTISLAPKVGN